MSGIPMHNLGQQSGPVKASEARFYQVTDKANRFRDISEDTERKELATQVGLGVTAALVAIGTVVAMYYCITTNDTYFCWNHMAIHTISNAPLAIIPGVFGTFIVAGLAAGAITVDLDSCRNGYQSKTQTNESIVETLTQGDLNKVYDTYYKKNGGLTVLVQKGCVSVEQANQLREVFKQVAQERSKSSGKYGTFNNNYNVMKGLQEQWQAIQREIQSQYRSSAADEVE